MSWNNNNRACACLWFFEKWKLNQNDVKFTPAGEWGTDFLIGAAAGESMAMRNEKAQTHAAMLDSAFINLFNAKYENDQTSETAVAALLAILKDKSKKLKDLSEPADSCYHFYGES